MSDFSPARLDELLGRLADGLLVEAEAAELDQILRTSPEARERYRVFSAAHLMLASGHVESMADHSIPIKQRPFLPMAAAAIALLASGIALWPSRPVESIPPVSVRNVPETPVLAVVALAENARWDLPEPAAGGMKLRSEPITLISGIVALDLIGGHTLTLRGPARFELIDAREMKLSVGDASLRMDDEGDPYIIRVPGGAVVDLGTEFSVNVSPEGTSDVHVFEGLVNASIIGTGDRTREERLLNEGQSVRISKTLETSPSAPSDFLRPLPSEMSQPSPAGKDYEDAVMRSAPAAWWNFEAGEGETSIRPAAGSQALQLHGNPLVAGLAGRRFLFTNPVSHAGFALTDQPLTGLDTPAGITVECLLFPLSERMGTALVLDEPALAPPARGPLAHLKHPPTRLSIERMGLRGKNIGHMHPDYAMRGMMRSPAGYEGGANAYSSENHLLHRWIHVVITNDGKTQRLYIDGHLSDEVDSKLPFRNAALRPIIARLHPHPELRNIRQWHGGIDEVAIYNRVLDPEEVRSHADALER